jgi:hypothetical protein
LTIDIHAIRGLDTQSSDRLVAVLSAPPFSGLRTLRFNGAWNSDLHYGWLSAEKFTSDVIDKLPVSASRTVTMCTVTDSKDSDVNDSDSEESDFEESDSEDSESEDSDS